MPLKLLQKSVGPWPMNTYVLICEETKTSAIVDPGADAKAILEMVEGTRVSKILITHTHKDHVGALAEIKKATRATIFQHPDEKDIPGVRFDISLRGGDTLKVGNQKIHTYHTPGHTVGMISFDIGDNRILVGDTLFVNGPGRTETPRDFATTMRTLRTIVFKWPNETVFYPGHGPSGKIGDERPAFEAFFKAGYAKDLCGDVAWK
ncbi:MAG TPA: MBL fold metallo-hydrolase [Anaerolineales bacterium]|nr:MBL fold metallo-hydrolase [Anaerolineales bacterium]